MRDLWRFYLGLALAVPLVMLPWALKDRWMRLAGLTCGLVVLGLLVETWTWPHYAAPFMGLLLALVLQAMRCLRLCRWRGNRAGHYMVWAILLLCVSLAPQARPEPQYWSLKRAGFLAWLEETS